MQSGVYYIIIDSIYPPTAWCCCLVNLKDVFRLTAEVTRIGAATHPQKAPILRELKAFEQASFAPKSGRRALCGDEIPVSLKNDALR